MKTPGQGFRAAALVAVLAAGGQASDWYVDATSGSNANSGTSPAQAWKTITHAVASTPTTGAQTIHVAPGIYDSALGEVFPWVWRPSLSLVGDQGSAVTHVFGSGAAPAIMLQSFKAGVAWFAPTNTLLRGLHFQGGSAALSMYGDWGTIDPTLRDVRIDGMSADGIDLITFAPMGGAFAKVVLEKVKISGSGIAVALTSHSLSALDFKATDCSFSGSFGEGVFCFATAGPLNLTLELCRIEHSASYGLRIGGNNLGSCNVALDHTTIAHNHGGIWAATSPQFFQARVTATQCTIADNGGVGVRMDHGSPSNTAALLDSTIIHGHADDLAVTHGTYPNATTVRYCEIGDGEGAGVQGNFQADPRFVNAPAGDYHLLPGSPCIDRANPALPIENDCSGPDVGAFPFVHSQSLAYCTAKLNSCGGLPSIGATGTPSATAPNGYVVAATGAKATKAGLLLYSLDGPAATPFAGGILCLAAPVRRSIAVIDSTGTPPLCDGTLALDMNAFARGSLGGNPHAALGVVGTRVDCQYWGRDTPGNALLSDALEYFVCQ